MNNAQRKVLNTYAQAVYEAVNTLRTLTEQLAEAAPAPGSPELKAYLVAARAAVDSASVTAGLEDVGGDEQEKFDNMPESLQNGANGERIQEAISALEDAISALEGSTDDLDTAFTSMEKASDPSDLNDLLGGLDPLFDALEEVAGHIETAIGA